VSVDGSDPIIAGSDGGTSIEVFAAGANGNVKPIADISGSKMKFLERLNPTILSDHAVPG
jgi:hypothetical protein